MRQMVVILRSFTFLNLS